MGVIDGAALSPGTQRGKRGGGSVKVLRVQIPDAGGGAWPCRECPDGEGVAFGPSGINPFWAAGFWGPSVGLRGGRAGGGGGRAGWIVSLGSVSGSQPGRGRARLPAFEEPGGCLSLCVSPVAPSSLWLVGSPGSRGGPLLPPSESGRPAGPRRRRPRNRCACGGGAARRGVGPSGGRRRGNSAGPGVSRVCVG